MWLPYYGRGLRTVKTVNGEDTLFVSCKSGKLIAEADSDGNITKEYIYLEGDIFVHFQYEVPVAASLEAAPSAEPSQETAPEPMIADNPPVVAATSTPSDTAFLQPIYFLLLLKNKSAEGAYYYINNHLGAPQIITNDSGTVVWRAEYLPFGKVNISVSQIENNLRFPGQYYDAETGLHYNWNRYYDPETGRYIAADPIGLGGGMNLYAYVGGDPVNGVDPMGLQFPIPIPVPPPPIIAPSNSPIMIELPSPEAPSQPTTFDLAELSYPKRNRCGCTCTCRADYDGNMKNNPVPISGVLSVTETVTANNCNRAKKIAKKLAAEKLGAKPKHQPCRCTDRDGTKRK
ncbi:MAG: RHS repeat-associated core domain-containing protein [Candidatus Electrothrix sp. GW3-4]|uniref:RHS repeat domain-containing protein n=1 Tax=Candidatus Electrothrix sp. GW3-4 TaxID=3126740 RepID=UPI0030CD30F9